MKSLVTVFKLFSAISVLLALFAFGSDFLPVEGFNFGGQESIDGSYRYYKIVATEGANTTQIGIVLIFIGIVFLGLSKLISKRYS